MVGCSGHCGAAYHRPHLDGQFSLGIFDAIVLTDSSDLSADGLGVFSLPLFPFGLNS